MKWDLLPFWEQEEASQSKFESALNFRKFSVQEIFHQNKWEQESYHRTTNTTAKEATFYQALSSWASLHVSSKCQIILISLVILSFKYIQERQKSWTLPADVSISGDAFQQRPPLYQQAGLDYQLTLVPRRTTVHVNQVTSGGS